MPVIDGRWVSPGRYAAIEKAAIESPAAEEPNDMADDRNEAPKPKRSRRSKQAAEAALATATGLDITLED